jgi:hypothetical protein
VEYKTQPEVQDCMWREVHQSRYHMAEEAPICQGNLRVRAEFGYNAETLAAKQVLEGTCQFGEEFNKATKRFCEALDIRKVVPEHQRNLDSGSRAASNHTSSYSGSGAIKSTSFGSAGSH